MGKSKADFQSRHITGIATAPKAHVFRELGQPKVGHALKPKRETQQTPAQPEEKAAYRGGGAGEVGHRWLQNLETCPVILGICHPEPSAF